MSHKVEVLGVPRAFQDALNLYKNPPLPFEFEKWFGLSFNRNMVLSDRKVGGILVGIDMWFYDSQNRKVLVEVITDQQPPLNTIQIFAEKIEKSGAASGVLLSLYGAPYIAMMGLNSNPRIDFVSCEQMLNV